jgi:selenocysteine lyase/cysteine desulfurase
LRSHAPDYRISLDELAALLTPATRLVCISHCSNIFGTINPIEEIAEIVHRAGALLCVDGVGFAPHREIDVRRWNVDFYVFSLYKTFGPHYALLYGRKKLLKRLPGIHHVFISEDAVPYKLQPGGTIYEFVYAAAAIPAYFEKLGRRLCASDAGAERRSAACRWVAEQEEALSERFLTFLNSRSDVLVIGSRRSDACIRVPIISFICGRDSRAVSEAVGRAGLTLRHGTFSAYRYCQQQKLDARGGVLRASFAHYNSLDDVDRLISALSPALSESS